MSYTILFIIGGVLMVAEIFCFTYFLLFVGAGVLVTGGLQWAGAFGTQGADGVVGGIGGALGGSVLAWQIVSVVAFSLLFLLVLRPHIRRLLQPSERFTDNERLKTGGVAVVEDDGIVRYNGTLWEARTDGYAAGERVEIEIDGAKAKILRRAG